MGHLATNSHNERVSTDGRFSEGPICADRANRMKCRDVTWRGQVLRVVPPVRHESTGQDPDLCLFLHREPKRLDREAS